MLCVTCNLMLENHHTVACPFCGKYPQSGRVLDFQLKRSAWVLPNRRRADGSHRKPETPYWCVSCGEGRYDVRYRDPKYPQVISKKDPVFCYECGHALITRRQLLVYIHELEQSK